MQNDMIDYIKSRDSVSSITLATEFLKFKNADEKMAHIAVSSILARDKRCSYGDDKLWHIVKNAAPAESGRPLAGTIMTAVYLLTHQEGGRDRVNHLSMWRVTEPPELLLDAWITDPEQLPADEQELLQSVHDTPFAKENIAQLESRISALCDDHSLIFLSARQLALFTDAIMPSDATVTENAILMSSLCRCAGVTLPRPLTLDVCCKAVLGLLPVMSYAYKYGQHLAACALDLRSRLLAQGVSDMSELDAVDNEEISDVDFIGKDFSMHDIVNASTQPGVYGFKRQDNSYLYIGKARNLRRRLRSYFRDTQESPDKIVRLRTESHGLITHVCGSELESLLYEYRLIQKHLPVLNRQVAVDERKGDFLPVDDCVILLPHADAYAELSQGKPLSKGMSFWFRKNQKIKIQPILSDFTDETFLIHNLNTFFFSGVLPPNPTDFPEQEIATRWIKKHRDELPVVFVNRLIDAKEVFAAMKNLWSEVLENPGEYFSQNASKKSISD